MFTDPAVKNLSPEEVVLYINNLSPEQVKYVCLQALDGLIKSRDLLVDIYRDLDQLWEHIKPSDDLAIEKLDYIIDSIDREVA